jgi:hypothetical protein
LECRCLKCQEKNILEVLMMSLIYIIGMIKTPTLKHHQLETIINYYQHG